MPCLAETEYKLSTSPERENLVWLELALSSSSLSLSQKLVTTEEEDDVAARAMISSRSKCGQVKKSASD